MCEPILTWNVVAMIWALVMIALVVADLLLRYLNRDRRGLISYKAILSLLFLFPETTFQDVDNKNKKSL